MATIISGFTPYHFEGGNEINARQYLDSLIPFMPDVDDFQLAKLVSELNLEKKLERAIKSELCDTIRKYAKEYGIVETPSGSSLMLKLTPFGREVKDIGSYTKYIESKRKKSDLQYRIDELTETNLELANENLVYTLNPQVSY